MAFEVKSGEKRTPSPPSVEHTVQGAKDAFTETNRSNTNLLRRHLRSPLLRFREFPVGSKSHTNVTVVWLEGTTPPHLVRRLERRLRGLTVESFVTPGGGGGGRGRVPRHALPAAAVHRAAGQVAQALLDGQVGLFVDGLPLGYLAPVDLASFLTSPEDQAVDFVTASCIRVIRYAALLASLLLPGPLCGDGGISPGDAAHQAAAVHHREQAAGALSHPVEVLGCCWPLRFCRRPEPTCPQSLGQAVSIIGGLVVGTAAVEAKITLPGGADSPWAAAGICGLCDTGPGSGQRRPRVAVCPGGLRRSGRAVRTHRRASSPCCSHLGRPGDLRPGLSAPLRPGPPPRRGPPPQNPLRSPAPRQGPQRLAMRGGKRPLHTANPAGSFRCGKPQATGPKASP